MEAKYQKIQKGCKKKKKKAREIQVSGFASWASF